MMSPIWSCQLAVLALLSLTITQVSAMTVEYCSSLNTASTSGNYSIYQSNGLCYNFCLASYAFAVLQGSDCYCSDYVPGPTTSGSDCSEQCPGYPDDLCGNSDEGLFGYIAGSKLPLGTKSADSAAPSSTAASVTVITDPTTVFITPPETPGSSTVTSPSDSPTPTPPPDTSTPTDPPSSSMTWTPTPVVSLYTITGEVHTVTITPTVPPNSQNLGGVTTKKKSGGGLSTGGAVGLTIGLVALVALVCAIIYFCWRRRQKEKEDELGDSSLRGSSAGLGGPIPSRTMSENSRYVLNTDGRQVIESYEGDVPGSRRSRLIPIDPRLNPHAPLYQRGENKSRESVNTIRDDHDYSRPVHQQGPILRATNPDE